MPITVKVKARVPFTIPENAKPGDAITVEGDVDAEVPQEQVDRHLGSKFSKWAAREDELNKALEKANAELAAIKSGGSPEFAKRVDEAVAAAVKGKQDEFDAKLAELQARNTLAEVMAKTGAKLAPVYARSIVVNGQDTEASIKEKVEKALAQQAEELKALGIDTPATGGKPAIGNGGNGGGVPPTADVAKLAALSKKFYQHADSTMSDAERATTMLKRVELGLFDLSNGAPTAKR